MCPTVVQTAAGPSEEATRLALLPGRQSKVKVWLVIAVSSLLATTSWPCDTIVCKGAHFVAAEAPDKNGALGCLAKNHWILVAYMTICPPDDPHPLTVYIAYVVIPVAGAIDCNDDMALSPRPQVSLDEIVFVVWSVGIPRALYAGPPDMCHAYVCRLPPSAPRQQSCLAGTAAFVDLGRNLKWV